MCKKESKADPKTGYSKGQSNHRVTLALNEKHSRKTKKKQASDNEMQRETLEKRGRKKHNLDQLAQRTQNTIQKLVQ